MYTHTPAIITNVRRGALRCTEAIAYTVRLPRVVDRAGGFGGVLYVLFTVVVFVSRLVIEGGEGGERGERGG